MRWLLSLLLIAGVYIFLRKNILSAAVIWDGYMHFLLILSLLFFLCICSFKPGIAKLKLNHQRIAPLLSLFPWVVLFQFELQVAEIIKEDLWPNPLKYFNNVISLSIFLLLFCFIHIIPVLCSISWWYSKQSFLQNKAFYNLISIHMESS